MQCTECAKNAVARGFCHTHYERWRKHGDASIVLCSGREGSRKYSLKHDYFDNIVSSEQAYWLGFIVADGCVIDSKKTHALRVELAEKDRGHVRLLADSLGSDKPLQQHRGCVSISLDSWCLVESLGRLGVTPRKSASVRPWDGPANLMPHFWRGLFDGDGSICRSRNYWQMGICGSADCVYGFAQWARTVCASRAKPIPVKPGSSCWQWIVAGSTMPRLLAKALYTPGDVALERKRVLANTLCGRG
jgi:hypothetical protein